MKEPEVTISRSAFSYEKMYLKERKKSTIFLITTVIFALLFAGSLIIHFGDTNNSKNGAPNFGSSSFQNSNSTSGMRGGNQGGFGESQTSVTDYFNSDGSVNTTKVSSELTSAETRAKNMIKKQIEQATSSGDITNSQETALEKAFGFND